jgi:HlyD family secretion protein
MISRVGSWVRAHPRWSVALVLAAALLLYLLLRPTPRDYVYVTQAVERGDVVRQVTASGKLRALNTIKVGAEVSGQILRVHVDFNSPVQAGQLLAEIDSTRLRSRVEQARAQVSSAQAALATARASVTRATTDIAVQQRSFSRRNELAERGFVSKAELDAAANALASARAGLQAANAQVQTAQAQIAQANAELRSAELDLSRTRIVAPASGVVINKLVEPGTTVVASFQTPNLFEIAADITRMQVEASVDEADIGQVREGQMVRFSVDSYPDESFAASVRQIRKAASETQNVVSYLVILDVDNKGGKLLPGMTANVAIVTGEKKAVLRVPTAALRFRPRSEDRGKATMMPPPPGQPPKPPAEQGTAGSSSAPSVYLSGAEPYEPEIRRITIGLRGEDFVEVTSGLSTGDKVVVRSRSTKAKAPGEGTGDDDNATP